MKSKQATIYTSVMGFKNHLESIKTTLVDYPSYERLCVYIPEFVSMTWLERIDQIYTYMSDKHMTRKDLVDAMFNRQTLPTALETVNLTFFIEGLDMTGVTHLIRHRMFSYSAQSSDPVTMEGHDILENDAFNEHLDLRVRARELCTELNDLYIEALDRGMSFYDARHFMPRAKEAKYFMSGNIKEFMGFINVRLGRQNQPTSDNILAARMRAQIIGVYPILEKFMPVEMVQRAYTSNINEKCNLNTYPPDACHREYLDAEGVDYSEAEFKHPKARDEYTCNKHFEKLFKEITE